MSPAQETKLNHWLMAAALFASFFACLAAVRQHQETRQLQRKVFELESRIDEAEGEVQSLRYDLKHFPESVIGL